jgi:hypothetical protein
MWEWYISHTGRECNICWALLGQAHPSQDKGSWRHALIGCLMPYAWKHPADAGDVFWKKGRKVFGLPTEMNCWCCNCFHERSSGVSPAQHGDSPGHRGLWPCGEKADSTASLFFTSWCGLVFRQINMGQCSAQHMTQGANPVFCKYWCPRKEGGSLSQFPWWTWCGTYCYGVHKILKLLGPWLFSHFLFPICMALKMAIFTHSMSFLQQYYSGI